VNFCAAGPLDAEAGEAGTWGGRDPLPGGGWRGSALTGWRLSRTEHLLSLREALSKPLKLLQGFRR